LIVLNGGELRSFLASSQAPRAVAAVPSFQVCLRACICTCCMCVCLYVCMYVYRHEYMYVYACLYVYVHVCMYMHVYMYVYAYLCIGCESQQLCFGVLCGVMDAHVCSCAYVCVCITAFFLLTSSFILRKVEDVTTISNPQSLTSARIKKCTLRVPNKTFGEFNSCELGVFRF